MIDNDAQTRHFVVHADDGLDQVRPRVGRIQGHAGLLEKLEPFNEGWVGDLIHQVVTPKIAIPDAEEQPVFVVTVQVFLELGFFGLQVADGAHHHRVFLFDFEHPQVVFDPRAGFHLDGPDYPQRHCQLAIAQG